MLNVYLAPRGYKAPLPSAEAIAALTAYLEHEGIVGPPADGAHPPGPAVVRLFSNEAVDTHLPAELTFDALRVVTVPRPRFLPERRHPGALRATCGECGDELDRDAVEEAIARLRYTPIDRFSVSCAACRAILGLRSLAFETPVGWSRFWIHIEGIATWRLNPTLVERLGRILGVALHEITEVPEEAIEDWVPARRAQWRR